MNSSVQQSSWNFMKLMKLDRILWVQTVKFVSHLAELVGHNWLLKSITDHWS